MSRPFRDFLFGWGICLLAVVGCGDAGRGARGATPVDSSGKSSGLPRVITTVGMVTDIVRQVADGRAEVTGLLNEGVDPHLYHPTRNDVQRLSNADVIFYGGLMLEGRMEESLHKLKQNGKVKVFAISESLDHAILRKPPEFDGHFDPHVWMDVKLWSQCVSAVASGMSEFDPAHAQEYRERAEAYQKELGQLDEYVRGVIESIPREQRVLVTAHDAFGYFARAYDLEVKSVQGISTDSEAGVADINSLVDLLVERKIGAIFVESSVSDKGLQAVIEGAATRGWKVRVGGELFSDAMGPAGTYRGTYIGMIDHNATVIARELGGKALESGFSDKLTEIKK